MAYKDQLFGWCIIRPLPDMQSRIVGRFRRRVDAEGHLQVLQRMIATVSFEIMFDIPQEDTQEADKQHTQERLTEE